MAMAGEATVAKVEDSSLAAAAVATAASVEEILTVVKGILRTHDGKVRFQFNF